MRLHIENQKPKTAVIEHSAYIENTIVNLTATARKDPRKSKRRKTKPALMEASYEDMHAAFVSEIDTLLDTTQPDRMVMERFQNRLRSKSCETVNFMGGIFADHARARGVAIRLIPASEWKNRIGKEPLQKLYLLGKQLGLKPHTIDTLCMAVYDASKVYGFTMDVGLLRKLIAKAATKVEARPKK